MDEAEARTSGSQARDIAARVILIREKASGRGLGVMQRGLSELLRNHGFSKNPEDDQHSANEESSDKHDESNQDGCCMEPMNVAL